MENSLTSADFNQATGYVIYEGFGKGIRALDQTLPSADMQRLPGGGRGYIKQNFLDSGDATPKIYTGAIHALAYAEGDPSRILNQLTKTNDGGGSLYMGAAGFMNLSFMAAIKPGAAILYDINPLQTWFWNHILPIIAEEKTAEKFLDAVVADSEAIYRGVTAIKNALDGRPDKKNDLPDGLPPQDYIKRIYINTLSGLGEWRQQANEGYMKWVHDIEGYEHIHNMARSDAIGALTLDVLDKEGWAQLAGYLSTRPAGAPSHVKTNYPSNIFTFLEGGEGFNELQIPGGAPALCRKVMSQVMDPDSPRIIGSFIDVSMDWPMTTTLDL